MAIKSLVDLTMRLGVDEDTGNRFLGINLVTTPEGADTPAGKLLTELTTSYKKRQELAAAKAAAALEAKEKAEEILPTPGVTREEMLAKLRDKWTTKK